MRKSNKRKKKAINWKIFSRKLMVSFLIIAIAGLAGLIGVFAVAARDLPKWDPELLSGAKTTIIYDDKEEFAAGLHAGENRTEVSLDKVPQDFIDAFIATEDRGFYDHHGINYRGIIRSLVSNITSGDLKGQGASTITQQLARNAFLSFDKKWERKIKEILLAFKIESAYSKDEILTMYLNLINFGSGAYGVQAAAETYFGKDVSELNLAECSMLAGVPNAPSLNPFQNLEWSKKRQKIVLYNMVEAGYIDQATADEAYAVELEFRKSHPSNSQYGYYIDAVIDEAIGILSAKEIYNDLEYAFYRTGLKIYTTMNADIQKYAEEYFADPSHFLQQKNEQGESVQAAMAIIDHQTGGVKAIMGGRTYEQRRGFNRATNGYRQPGSAIKPLTVYLPALEAGYMPFYILDDSPLSYKVSGGVWQPKNYDGTYRGLITMRTAVKNSVNTYAVQLLGQIGIRNSFDYGCNLGLELIDKPGTNDLGLAPLALGGLTRGATPLQMAAAYGAIANGGIYQKPHFITRIVDEDGAELYRYQPESHRAISEQASWLMTSMMRTVVESGTGTNARVSGVVTAGKTGTSEEYMDSWFCGFTPAYSMAVWMGFDKEYTMRNYPPQYPSETAYGGNCPARAFSSILNRAHKEYKPAALSMPGGIVNVSICSVSGKRPGESCPDDKILNEYCLKDQVPSESCNLHQMVSVCTESGKIAGPHCPQVEMRSVVIGHENSSTPDKMPEDTCDIHTHPTFPGMFTQEVYICRDPGHEGKLYRANIPRAMENGGCPEEYLDQIILEPGQNLPYCPLKDHQTSKKKAKEVIQDIIDRD
jgi:penicillin-binding protein 1A